MFKLPYSYGLELLEKGLMSHYFLKRPVSGDPRNPNDIVHELCLSSKTLLVCPLISF